MNKHIDVFVAIKVYCNQHNKVDHVCNFEDVAKAANVELGELEEYLAFFKKLGLITYSLDDDKYLFLTSLGARYDSQVKND